MFKRAKIITCAVMAVICASTLLSCKSKNSPEKISLKEGWVYKLEADGAYNTMSPSMLSDLTPLIPGKTGFIYLKRDFQIPASLMGQDLSIYLGRITMADEAYINGVLIGKKGQFGPENEWSAWNKSRLYHIPTAILNENGMNTLEVKIWGDGECSVTSNPYIGSTLVAERTAASHDFWNSKINFLFAAIMVLIGAYHLLIFFQRTRDHENFMFAFINFVTALYLSVFYIDEMPGAGVGLNFLWFQKIMANTFPFFIPFLVTSFLNEFFKRKEKKWIMIVRIIILVLPIGINLFSRNYPELRSMRSFTQLFLVPPMGYILFLVIKDLVKKEKDIIPVLLGFSPLVLAVFADLFIHNILKLNDVPYLSMYGWMIVILAFLFILATKFAKARAEAEDLNLHLEQKVDARTKELSELNEKLEQVNSDTERDVRMAAFVQQSFYPRKAPQLSDYEIAYVFKPMAGVSGDLYDFYTTGSKLDGVSLFDVSGHGISSGLVTMLSKTIITREFENGKDEKLSDIMYAVNDRICSDKGDVENYLTGIMLRFNGNTVDYVNAGHPSLLFRTAGGKAIEAKVPGSSASGSLVGMPYIPVEYKTMRFNLNKGDALLLYTDCLQESRDINGEEYQSTRIMKSLEKAQGITAQQKLNCVLNDFNAFTKDVPLKDDLTVIMIVKK